MSESVIVTALVFNDEFSHLNSIAQNKHWHLTLTEVPGFILVLPARDGSKFVLQVECDNYPETPPSWRWTNLESGELDQPQDTPAGENGYFHPSRRICAPWNRNAYRQVDEKGPHRNWKLAAWMENSSTGECTTLSAMALRLSVELLSDRYKGRMG